MDIYEKDDELVVKAAVPGIGADELDITITGDVLTIKGETHAEEKINEEHYYRREFRHGSFCRSVRLPIEVQADQATAIFKDSVLTLSFPKLEEEKPHTVPVKLKR